MFEYFRMFSQVFPDSILKNSIVARYQEQLRVNSVGGLYHRYGDDQKKKGRDHRLRAGAGCCASGVNELPRLPER